MFSKGLLIYFGLSFVFIVINISYNKHYKYLHCVTLSISLIKSIIIYFRALGDVARIKAARPLCILTATGLPGPAQVQHSMLVVGKLVGIFSISRHTYHAYLTSEVTTVTLTHQPLAQCR